MINIRSKNEFSDNENEILNDYCMFQGFYNHTRQQFKKNVITPYNKKQKKAKEGVIKSYHLLERDYPQLVLYYSQKYSISDLSLLFENNFTKLTQNTSILPTFQIKTYGTRRYKIYTSISNYTFFSDCYKDGSSFVNKLNLKTYTIRDKQLVDKDGNTFSMYNLLEKMYLFSEI